RDVELDLPDRGVAAVPDLEVAELEHELALALGLLVRCGRVGNVDPGLEADVGRHVDDVSGGVGERGHRSVLGGHAVCRREKNAVTKRARMVNRNTIRIKVSAAPQDWSCAGAYGWVAFRKICT